MLSTQIRSRPKKKAFSHKKAFSYTALSTILNSRGAALKNDLNSELSRSQRPGAAASPRKKSLFVRGEGVLAQGSVAGVGKHTLSSNLCM